MWPQPYCENKYKPNLASINTCLNEIKQIPDVSQIIKFGQEIEEKLSKALEVITLRPVVYDELEFFKDSDVYPFQKRKNVLPSLMPKTAGSSDTL